MTNMRTGETARGTFRKVTATLLLAMLPVQVLAAPMPQTGTAQTAAPQRPTPPRVTRPFEERIPLRPASDAVTTLAFFGPRKYVRTTGAKDVYTATVAIPAWLKPPFRLFVQNGEADGTFRVSSATVEINGTALLTQSDFNQNAATYERTITLPTPVPPATQASSLSLVVTLASKPTSYLTIWLYGAPADKTAPTLDWLRPASGSTINDITPEMIVQYSDPIGVNEPAAAGVDLASLRVSIDDVDVSERFTRRSDEASGEIAEDTPLTAGLHTYKASIADRAGNVSHDSGQFRVDLTNPTLAFTTPAAGAYLATKTPGVSVSYADDVALDLTTLEVQVNGVALPAGSITAAATSATIVAGTLDEGPNQITASIRDAGGNTASAAVAFNVDVTAPALTIAQPAAGARIGSRDVTVTLTWSDAQGIVPATAAATIDGTASPLNTNDDGATAQLTALADGSHTFSASVKDRAGNRGSATVTFIVDTTLPVINVVAPPAGANINDNTPQIDLTYNDNAGVVTDSLKVKVNATDQTALFTKTATSATGQVTTALPEGTTSVAAEIRDTTGNVGATTSSFRVDTIAPTGTIDAPLARVNSATPLVTVSYADAGSGIDPTSVALTVDGAAVSGVLSAGPDSASGALLTPLTDGPHTLQVTFADRAGNPATLSTSFTVDTVLPQLAVAVPANGTFVNTSMPPLRVTYEDTNGTGVDLTSLRLFLQQGSEAEIDVTSYVTKTALEATGLVPPNAALSDGTYQLRAVIRDLAGNESVATSRFEVDTVAPTVEVETPARNGYVASATPSFVVRWTDALSGVDAEGAKFYVDDDERTNRFTVSAEGATGQLAADESLAEGPHVIRVVAFDRAGNAAAVLQQLFTVDTIVPTVQIDSPAHNGYVGPAPYSFAATFGDGTGSGVAPTWVAIAIDGVDRTAEFTITPTTATATIATALANGAHTMTISVLDWAGNSATASASFTADAVRPVVAITSPAAGAWISGATVNVTGTVQDASPVSIDVNGVTTLATNGAFTATIPTENGSYVITATATDAAANTGTASVTVNIDSAPPLITVTTPALNFVTKESAFTLSGTVTDTSAVTLLLDAAPVAVTTTGTSNAFSTSVPLTADGVKSVILKASDQAGNSSTKSVSVTRDTVAPQVTVLSPALKAVVGSMPVFVSGTLRDETVTTLTVDGVGAVINGEAWQVEIPSLVEGTHTFALVATDAAGNVKTLSHEVTVDLTAPSISISTPLSGTLTKLATTTVTGTVSDTTLVSVKVGKTLATLTPGATPQDRVFTAVDVSLADGDNTLVATATDALARTSTASTLVTRDSIAPIVVLDAPTLITRTRPAHIVANVQENLAIRDVVFSLDGALIATKTTAPFQVDVVAPAAALPGTTLLLTVVATDTAGNITTVSKELRVTSDGAVTGLVLSHVTGLPIANARVRIAGQDARNTTTDTRGRYALPANDQNLVLVIEEPSGSQTPMTSVERTVAIQSAVGTIPVDARLTPLGPDVAIGVSGGTLTAGDVTVTVPGGALGATTAVRLTELGPQGLPNLLPLGWAPAGAFDLRVDSSIAVTVPFQVAIENAQTNSANAAALHLVRYDTATHAWTVTATNVTRSGGVAEAAVPQPGSYALVFADDVNVPVPASGDLLAGVEMKPIPDTATSSGNVNPPTLPPTGGSAVGTLTVHSPQPLPSGTVVQAEVTETFTLATGEIASEEKRTQDLVLFREGQDVTAQFPIVPSRSFASGALVEGRVHLDILAGREAVRGRTGGSQALTLDAGDVSVTVPAGSLPDDLAISATPSVLSLWLPSTASARPVAELVLDFGGVSLGNSAVLSIPAGNIGSDTVVVARVERVNGVPKVVVVSATDLVTGRFVSKDLGTLAGVRRDGRYVFYRVNVPWSLVAGSVGLSSTSMQAVVTVEGFPFVALTNSAGEFDTIAPTGSVKFSASVPNTSLSGDVTVSVVSGQTASPNINLNAQATTATITPENGALHVPTSAQIEIVATAPIRTSSANNATIKLRNSAGTNVPLRFVFSGSGRTVAAIPQALLTAGETYTVTVSGLGDVYGSFMTLAPVTFTTNPDVPPDYDTQKVTFTMPGADGLVTVSAPAGSLPPGTRVMIVNAGNGIVVSFTVGNDGSFTGTFPATINDRLMVTITDPKGNVVTFDRSQFVATDGSGRTAIGPGGGIVEGPGGVQLRIPEGALDQGAIFKVEALPESAFPQKPEVPNGHFGGGLKITSEQKPKLKKEADLVFPRPADAPEGSFYYVYRRLNGPDGQVGFQTIDHAFDDGNGKVVTASYPFIGWKDSVAAWTAKADLGGLAMGIASELIFSMMYTWDALLPGSPVMGVVAGHVYRPVWDPGAIEPRYEPVSGAMVRRTKERGINIPIEFAVSEDDGHFVFYDPLYTGGTVEVEAEEGNDLVRGTAFEANVSNTRSNAFAPLYNTYGYAAEVNLTFPAQEQPPPAPDVDVVVMTLDQTQNLLRRPIDGVIAADTPLLIGFKFNNGTQGEIFNATVNTEEFPVRPDDGTPGREQKMDYVLSSLYAPRNAGTYSVKATARNPLGGAPLEVDHTFLVVAGGGTNNASIPGVRPDWITRKLVPKENSLGIAVDVLPQVVFTEPVVNVLAGLQFTSDTDPAQYTISATAVGPQGQTIVIQDLRTALPDTKITAITIVPKGGLNFSTTYSLKLTGAIHDTDVNASGQPAWNNFPDRVLTFTTIDPAPLGDSADIFSSSGIAVIGDHAYVGKSGTSNGWMSVYDIGDPEAIRELGTHTVLGMPTHLDAEADSPVLDGHTAVAIGSGLKFNPAGPSNVYLFDVSNPAAPKRKAIVTLTESAEEGIVLKLALRKSFLYTITYPHGIQVIDLERAVRVHEEWSADPARRYRMILDSVVAGRGFGQEAVVNTVRVTDPNTGIRGHLMDLEADQYVVNGSARTLVIATGSTPFVIVDPTETSPRLFRVPGSEKGTLEFGRSVRLTRINNRDVALIVGTGQVLTPAGGFVTGTGLYIFDMNNPLSPHLMSSIVVDGSGSDVDITGTTAVVATAGGAMTFSLSDPYNPRYLGTVEGVGYRIALGQEGGYIVSTGSTGLAGAGLHVASFKPVVIIKKADPVQITMNGDGTVTAPQQVKADAALTVNIKVIPAVSGLSGTVTVINKRFPGTDGQDRGITPTQHSPYTIQWTNAAKGEGTFTIPSGESYEDTDLVASASVSSDNGELRSVPRTIHLGWVRLDVDSNNNTEIDGQDREAARKGRAFGFWESDPWYDLKKFAATPAKESGASDKALTDYFTVRITVNKLWRTDGHSEEVRLRMDRNNVKWTIVRKLRIGKDHLRDEGYSNDQVKEIVGGLPYPIYEDIQVCRPTDTLIHVEGGGECRPNPDLGYVNLPPLVAGTYEFLVRCIDCGNRTPGNYQNVPKLVLEYAAAGGTSAGARFDEARADIRPVRQWITYMTARNENVSDFKPLSYLSYFARNPDWYDNDDHELKDHAQRKWANDNPGWSHWASQMPLSVKNVTIAVHGYKVTDSGMRNIFLPTIFKRLYWAGHPVHRLQGRWREPDDNDAQGCVKNCAHTVGIAWPSNYGGREPGQPGVFSDTRESVQSIWSGLLFPQDEYRAFATGPAMAKYFKEVRRQVPERRIGVLAHSLGNLAVHSAISRPEMVGNVIDRFIMNEAAMPAEALAEVPVDEEHYLTLWGERHPERFGYPNDQVWIDDYDQRFGPDETRKWQNNLTRLRDQVNTTDPSMKLRFTDAREFYSMRWRMDRSSFGVPNHNPDVLPTRGQWRGFFSDNTNRVENIFNTFSTDDRVLRVVWRSNQIENKPFGMFRRVFLDRVFRVSSTDRFQDDHRVQYWAELDGATDAQWDSVFGGEAPGQYWTIKRQWAELSYWFPSTAAAAGSMDLDGFFPPNCSVPCETEMTKYSKYTGWQVNERLGPIPDTIYEALTYADTHSYLGYGQFTTVFQAFEELRKMFDLKD
jgi:hypothetical protein